ncbi:hypothetical protein BKI52_01795 [marine bacterium AO1-C]|nr:hypothetical protein BKI52_01795 [marine bacterium AO1-C]
MKQIFVISLFIIVVFTKCGTSNKNSVQDQADNLSQSNLSEQGNPETEQEGNLFENADFIKKYNGYIAFKNSFHKGVVRSYRSYFKWADKEKGPQNSKRTHPRISTLSDYSLKDAEEKIAATPEIANVDNLMQIVLKNARELFSLVETANGYYKKENYKDDDFAEGKKLHPQLVTAFEKYFDAYDKMNVPFKKLQDELFIYDVEKYKTDGKDISYNLMVNMKSVEKSLGLIGNLDGSDLKKIDLEAFDKEVKEFRKTHEALEKLSKNKEQVDSEFKSMNKNYLDTYINVGMSLIKEIRNFKERIQKNNFKYGITHPSIPDEGSPAKLRKLYSELIRAYNSLNR